MFAKKTINEITPYKLVPQCAWEDTEGVLKLDWNESTQGISPYVKKKNLEAIDSLHFNWYPNIHNNDLINAIAEYVKIPIDYVMYFASSDAAQEYIARTYLEAFDKVMIVGPTYDNFRVTCQSESYNIYFSFLDDFISPDIDKIEQEILKSNPKLVYISNPNNPTGTMYPVELIQHLIERFTNVLFLIDEAYIEFSKFQSSKDLVISHRNIIISRTFSKAFGLAGFRVGYIIAHPSQLEYIGRIRNPKSVTSLTQVAALAVLEDIEYMKSYVTKVLEAKRCFTVQLDLLKIKFICGGGNFVLINSGKSKELYDYLRSNKIFIRDYTQVSKLNGYDLRITIGTKPEMQRVLDCLRNFIS